MTDLAPTPEPTTAPAAPPPEDYKAKYEAEVQERIRERNLYKPAQQMLNRLDDGARAAVLELAQLADAGDPQAIVDWALFQAEQVGGKPAADIIAERQAREQAANTTAVVGDQVPGLTADQVEEIVAQRMAAESIRQQGINRVAAEMKAAGYEHDSPVGETIIRYAVATGNDLPDAIKWYENEVQTTALQRAQAAAAAAQGSAPPGAPQGSPASTQPDAMQPNETPQEFSHRRALARLEKRVTT